MPTRSTPTPTTPPLAGRSAGHLGARHLALATAGACLVALLPALATPASAAGVRVLETGRVTAIEDGDTIQVDVRGDGRGPRSVRLAGIQATETYATPLPPRRTWCHAMSAKAALKRLVLGKKVQLRAADRSSRSLGRDLRYVHVRSGGRWVDVQRLLLDKGSVMNLTLMRENARDEQYGTLAQRAASRRIGMWRSEVCGAGPHQSLPLRTSVRWDADGNDGINPNGEYVTFENLSTTTALSLRGWTVRDTSQEIYQFPSWARIEPGSSIRLHVGRGTNTARVFHWGLRKPLFQNVGDPRGTTEFVILMDRDGDFRSWTTYPCHLGCPDPSLAGLRIASVVADAPGNDNEFVNGEQVVLVNTGTTTARLTGHYLRLNAGLAYDFAAGRSIGPGGSLTVKLGRGTNDADTVYVGQTYARLANAGGRVEVRAWSGPRRACAAWGSERC